MFEYLLGALADVDLPAIDKLEMLSAHIPSASGDEEVLARLCEISCDLGSNTQRPAAEDQLVDEGAKLSSAHDMAAEAECGDSVMQQVLAGLDATTLRDYEDMRSIFPQLTWELALYVLAVHCQKNKPEAIQCKAFLRCPHPRHLTVTPLRHFGAG